MPRRLSFLLCAMATIHIAAGSLAWGREPGRWKPGRWEAGASVNYAWIVFSKSDEPKGGGVGIHLRYGLSENISLKIGALWSGHDLDATEERPGGIFHVLAADAGLTYAIDLMRFSPKIEAGVGILWHRLGEKSEAALGVKIGLAGDYHITPWMTIGLGVFYHGFLTDLGNIPVYVELGPRVSIQWGGAD